jgi:phospholipase/carboxylesterase
MTGSSETTVVTTLGSRALRVTTDERGPLVVLLHGLAGTPEDLQPFVRSMGVSARFILPEGFSDLSQFGLPGRGWWPSDGSARAAAIQSGKPRDLSRFEPPGLDEAHAALGKLLDEWSRESDGAPLVLGGFSQGAMLAFDVALRSKRAITGLVQLSGAPIAARLWNPELARRSGTRAFISHGRTDPDLSFTASECFASALHASGWQIDFCPFDGGHEVSLSALRGLKRFLGRL